MTRLYGLIGNPLDHSWSAKYFRDKFAREGLDCRYELFPLDALDMLPELVRAHPVLGGLNVTIPYKREILHYLEPDEEAAHIGAVNTVAIVRQGGETLLTGHNTDRIAFTEAYGHLAAGISRALVLGSGGAAAAVKVSLEEDLGIKVTMVSRSPRPGHVAYTRLQEPEFARQHGMVVNATPVGMYPHPDASPGVSIDALSDSCVLVDLVYNPEETSFLRKGKARGLRVQNGLEMLHRQAEWSWKTWNKPG